MVTPDFKFGDAYDEGGQDHGEEGTDIDDFQLFDQLPGNVEREENADREKNVAAYGCAGLFFAGSEVGRRSGQRISPVGC